MNVEHVEQFVMNERNEKNESFLTLFHFLVCQIFILNLTDTYILEEKRSDSK